MGAQGASYNHLVMNSRVLLLLLALVLVWSGHTVDRSASSPVSISVYQHDGSAAAALTPQAAGSEGNASAGDQTTQAAEEGVVDLVGLLPTDADAPSTLLLMTWPGPYATLAWIAPYLDGPQRPPRAAHLAA